MKIIIDAMGGDNAPRAFLEGGFRAAVMDAVDAAVRKSRSFHA